jgi:predicted ATPase
MATIDKEEIEKYIFDPDNPKACKSYKLLLNIARKENASFFSPEFLQYFYQDQILTKEFDEQIWDKPKDYSDLAFQEKIELFKQQLSTKELEDYFNSLKRDNIDTSKISKYSFIKQLTFLTDLAPIGKKMQLSEYKHNSLPLYEAIAGHMIGELRNQKFAYYNNHIYTDRNYLEKYNYSNTKYNKNTIILSKDFFDILKINFIKSSIFITLEENIDKFIEQNKNPNIKPLFLKKIEDVDLLLEQLQTDLKQASKTPEDRDKIAFVNNLQIKKYFSIENIELQNLKDKKEIYFVGENGDGKTILLQAILFGLTKRYSGDMIEHIKPYKDTMQINIQDEFATQYSENVDMKNIFAYGINRNKIDYREFDKYGYSGLFDTSDARKTTYLKDPFYELGQTYQGDNALIKEFIEKLNSIILHENYNVFNGGDIDFNELSEGYKSTLIWLYDLVSRLIENQPKVQNLSELKAIVLIDEIDLYLHPKWKYNFVNNFREVLPNIQFIMVTHSMVTILGARSDAIFYKVYKDENGNTQVSKPIDSIKNLMANNLSTSPLFDMDTARARNSDENIDTREDFISSKIHAIIKERVKGKKALIEDNIVEMINQELDDYLKEHDL